MLTPASIWWAQGTNATVGPHTLLAWGSRCAAAWGPVAGNLSSSGSFHAPAVAVIHNATDPPNARQEVLLEFSHNLNTTLRAGGAGAPPLAEFKLGSSGMTVLAAIDRPVLPATAWRLRTIVALGNVTEPESSGAAAFHPVLRLGAFVDEAGSLYLECTAWPSPEVQAAVGSVLDFSVLTEVPDDPGKLEVACVLDPRLQGPLLH